MNINLQKEAILRIGEVSEIDGRKVIVILDKNKNASDLLFNGVMIKNVSVGVYVEIRKGFLSIIGKVEGEKLFKEKYIDENNNEYQIIDKNKRFLSVSLCGYINSNGQFIGGIKELPLIANEVYLLTEEKINLIHNLLKDNTKLKMCIAKTEIDEIPVYFPVDGLFNSHIAIFGNTGSGKSNTLAALYNEMVNVLDKRNNSRDKYKLFFFDFNAEYIRDDCISNDKYIINLSTRDNGNDKIPMKFNEFIDIETLSILFEATEKTQRPFLKRALDYYKFVKEKNDINEYYEHLRNTIKYFIREAFNLPNKDTAFKILDYLEEILHLFNENETNKSFREDISYHNKNNSFYIRKQYTPKEIDIYFDSFPEEIENTIIFKAANEISNETIVGLSELKQFFIFLLLQLINDLLRYKVQIEHIIPVINRFKSKRSSIEKLFEINDKANIWEHSNIVILNLDDVNLDMKKTIPLLIAKYIYNEHKKNRNKQALSIIIDEAHNILSRMSFRETEDWKDYRLETFEEIIKEGRKFGVFVTIASQRPNDISETIISQAHNYFIHQLINQRDLDTIANTISYIDKITEEAIPTLPVGTCIFSGIATPMPIRLNILELPDNKKPDSSTLKFEDLTKEPIELQPKKIK